MATGAFVKEERTFAAYIKGIQRARIRMSWTEQWAITGNRSRSLQAVAQAPSVFP